MDEVVIEDELVGCMDSAGVRPVPPAFSFLNNRTMEVVIGSPWSLCYIVEVDIAYSCLVFCVYIQ